MTKRTITAALAAAAAGFPDRTYLAKKTDEGWVTFSFRNVYKDARNFAAWLLQHGIKKGDRVALFAEGSPEWVTVELGALLVGAVSVPLSIKLMPEEISFRLSHSEARILAVSRNMLEKAASVVGSLENPLTLVYLDGDSGCPDETLLSHGIPGRRCIRFTDCLDIGGRSLPEEELARIEAEIGENDTVTISYTSGTTGNPKGIMLTHLNYFTNSQEAVRMFAVPHLSYQTLLILPCDHSFAHTVGIFCALFRGISLYFSDFRGGTAGMLRSIPASLMETNPVFLLTVPALSGNFMKKIIHGVERRGGIVKAFFDMGLRAGVRYHGDGFNRPPFRVRVRNYFPYRLADRLIFSRIRRTFGNRLRYFVGGGALLDIKQQEFFNALGIPVFQGYGLTEASPVISSNTPRAHKFGTSGKVFPGVTCEIQNSGGYPAGIGETGEICIRGENVMKGYFRNGEATGDVIRDGRLYTGDLGYIDEDGFLVVVGREKALLISTDGEKYSPEEIEEAMTVASPVAAQVLLYNDHRKYTTALVVPDPDGVKALAAEHYLHDPKDLLEAVIDSVFAFRKDPYYAKRFPPQWLPATFRLLDEPFSEQNGMVNSTMKIVRHRILETYENELKSMYTPEADSPRCGANLEAIKRLIRKTPDGVV